MGIIEIHDNYSSLGINSRQITKGPEFDMVSGFIEFKKDLFKSKKRKRDLAIFIETKINGSYPDVVFAEYDPFCYSMWNETRNKLTKIDLKILHYIFQKRNVTSKKICSDLSMNYKSLLFSLEALMDAELIVRKNSYWIIQDRKNVFGLKSIEAVEAKISKWNEVTQQAIVNKAFASESFVLSKRVHEPEKSVVKKMDSFGIGIYLYNNDRFSCYSQASRNALPANYNSVYINECIGKILNS